MGRALSFNGKMKVKLKVMLIIKTGLTQVFDSMGELDGDSECCLLRQEWDNDDDDDYNDDDDEEDDDDADDDNDEDDDDDDDNSDQ